MAKQILVTLDRSPLSESILDRVAAIGAPGDAIVLLSVGAVPHATSRSGATPANFGAAAVDGVVGAQVIVDAPETVFAENTEQVLQRAESEIRDYLEAKATPLRQLGYIVETKALLDGDAAAAIVRFAREAKPDVIAMATHSRSAVGQVVFGSVATAVVRSKIAPVLLVHTGG